MLSARTSRVLGAVVAGVALAGCTESPSPVSITSDRSHAKACAGQELRTVTDGKLTLATYDPAYAPWFVGNDPGNGQGFESALAFRLAQQLGYRPADVTWKRLPFEQLVGGSDDSFDLGLAQVSVTTARAKKVQFTTPYASVYQALIAIEGTPVAEAKDLNELKSGVFGASAMTTSAQTINNVIKPTTAAKTYPSLQAAGQALVSKEIDGVVADMPTARYLADSVLDDGVVVGQLGTRAEQVAGVLPPKSSMKACINQALANLAGDGTLEKLQQEWLPAKQPTPPVLQQSNATASTSSQPSGASSSSSSASAGASSTD